jgi:5-oxoprolinase (ATP-hydrolysing)/N-methylhydantoinase A
MRESGRYRIGFDIGGTFTDFVLHDRDANALRLHKCLTTPEDPSLGAMAGLSELAGSSGIALSQVSEIIHGTTLVTNALIERRGVKLGLITTAGFRDLLELGTEQRYDIYDLFLKFPQPLAPRARRREVAERIDRDGVIVTPIDLDGLRDQARALVAEGVEAIAVVFLHAYKNPLHEQAAGALLRREFPGLAVSLSHEVVAEMREYPRLVTTCANAYVQPLMDRYVGRLESELAALGFSGAFRLMHSAGGLVSARTARDFPIRLLESGPAGGGIATALFGRMLGKRDVISFDMGGTTAKAAFVEEGRTEIVAEMEAARVHRFKKGSGLPIKAPVIDMIEIGAGGGSIAAPDEIGLLRVGPGSAGADPGPACYGRGGEQATVTDANVVLGLYDPAFFLGGRMTLDLAAAERAVARLGETLGLPAAEAANGIRRIVTENMAAAARTHLVERGRDPRDYAMVAFGGAGPAFAADVARSLGVSEVIVPPASGAASALGFLAAPLSFEGARSNPTRLGEEFDASAANAILEALEAEGRARLAEAGHAGAVAVERTADMRLVGQLHEITVPLPPGRIGEASDDAIRRAFSEVYQRRYASVFAGASIEIISFRVRVSAPSPELSLALAGETATGQALKGERLIAIGGETAAARVYDRYALRAGERIEGPAIIEENEATTYLPAGDSLTVDASGALVLSVATAARLAERIGPETSLPEAKRLLMSEPVNLEIMWSRLVTVVEEMWLTVCRTAFSLIISEAQDFACELLDARGEPLAHSPRAMPVFNLTMPIAVKALIERYPPETLQPGDVLVTNDPWLCAGHLFDICVATPIFRDGRVVAFASTVGHVSDIGGTKDSLRAREVYEEGLQIPPMKLVEAGRPNETLFRLIGENVRNSDQVLGDIHSFVAANEIGGERLLKLMGEYGLGDLTAFASVVQGLAEEAMRDAIRSLPDGTYQSTVTNNPLGTPLTYPLKLTVSGDALELDFEGAPAQLPAGGLNCTWTYTAAHATYPLKCILTPNVRGNAGCYRPFTVKAPQGSILNCDKPLSVNMRTRTGWYIAPNVFRALSKAAPEQVQAFTGLPIAINVYGRDAGGRIYSDHLFSGGGQGASAGGDGKSGLLYPTSAANTSIELFESRAPVLVLEKALKVDSGGAGRHRGGLGQRVRLRKLYEDGLGALTSVYPEGVGLRIEGLFGGLAGRSAVGRVVDPAGDVLRDCGTGQLVELTSPGEIVEIDYPGGAGFGDPNERDRRRVLDDIADGYVSPEAAERDYGLGAKAAQAAE